MQDATKGIAGHEGAGEVVKVAEDIQDVWKIGDRAGVSVSKDPKAVLSTVTSF
jgi:D-arabinose 1-dehydrogenase-like Zn-dependent alcohol dehydrogenase